MWERNQLVYTIDHHPDLGYLISAYAVLLNQDATFSMTFRRVSLNSLDDRKYEFDEHDQSIIALIDEYHEENLVKKFSKKSKRYADFILKEFSDELLEKQLRPYIENRICKIIPLLTEHQKQLYFKGERLDFIRNTPVTIYQDPAEVEFNFNRTPYEIRYFLRIRHQNEVLDLFESDAIVLSDLPAWILLSDKLYCFEQNFSSKKISPFISKRYVGIKPEFEEKYFKSFVLQSLKKFKYVNAIGFEIKEEQPEPVARLRMEKDWQGLAVLKLEFRYNKVKFDANSSDQNHVKLSYTKEQITYIKTWRNPKKEKQYLRILLEQGLELKDKANLCIAGEEKNDAFHGLVNWVNQHKKILEDAGFEWVENVDSKKYFTGEITLDVQVNAQIDWFDLKMIVRFGDFEVPFLKLKHNILFGKREYKLPDGKIAVLPEEWFAQYQDLLLRAKESEEGLKVAGNHEKLLHNVLPQQIPSVHTNYKDSLDAVAKPESDILLPKGIRAKLRPYQLEGYAWMQNLADNGLGACLADDMGLGKTLQTLCILQKCQEEFEKHPAEKEEETGQLDLFNSAGLRPVSLIVVPTSLIHNWAKEMSKFTSDLRLLVHQGAKRAKNSSTFKYHNVVLTSYGILRNDLKLFKDFEFEFIVLDESQAIKNPSSKIFKAVLQLKAKHRIILTGTPIENSLNDLWAQMTFLNPGLLPGVTQFRKEFLQPIEKEKDETKEKHLRSLIRPFILRRTKKEVARDLPEFTEDVRYCEMTPSHKKLYEQHKSKIRNYLMGKLNTFGYTGQMMNILKALMELRQLANHPQLYDPKLNSDSGKFEEVISMLESVIADHKILMFSSFVKHLELFEQYFKDKKIKYEKLTGSVPAQERSKIISRFQQQTDISVFLISLKAGGVGLNLTSADYVFILDPWWNPASEMQATSRAHRIGQKQHVFSYKFITQDSVEEKILDMQEKKKWLAESFVNSSNPLNGFSEKDIEMLFE